MKTNCTICARLGRTCVLCEAEHERAKRPAHGVIVPKEQREARNAEARHGT